MAAYEALETPQEASPFIPEDTFAARLMLIRQFLKLTQAQAAERCGLDDGSWSNWENGTRPRGMDRIVETISKELGIDRDWLMWGGPLRTGRFASWLSVLPTMTGQGTLLSDELEPFDFFSRPELAAV